MLCVVLKPIQAFHTVVSRVITMLVAFMASKEPQSILQKYESRSSHFVEGTMMAKYLRENRVQVQEPKVTIDYYLKGDNAEGLKFKEELANILKQ